MLIRALRITDKLGTALLRVTIWIGEVLLAQIYHLRLALFDVFSVVLLMFSRVRAGRAALETNLEQRRAIMARRAAEMSTRTVVREDPLKTQNRALSIFTMVLILGLIGVVLWFTSNTPQRDIQLAGGGPLQIATTAAPTITPTDAPTPTLSSNPLQASGSVVYALRQGGRDNLFAFTIGKGNPIRLTDTVSGDDRDPAWSPDGTKIAFVSNRDGNWELYVLDMLTGQTRALTKFLAYKASPTWSPDGAFIAYEAYENSNLDIYIVPADGSTAPQQLTRDPAPDFSPAWFPTDLGRKIAYTSLRDGNAEIYVIDLNSASELTALRVTATMEIDEEYPVWSPDGAYLAYSARVNGIDTIFVKHADALQAEPQIIGRGAQPTWSPDSRNLLFVQRIGTTSILVGGQIENTGVALPALSTVGTVTRPSWTRNELPPALIASGGVPAPTAANICAADSSDPQRSEPPLFSLKAVSVSAPSALLSDRVDDSFNGLRQLVIQRAGYDFLGTLADAYWDAARVPEPGQGRESWHFAGRAFAFDRNLVYNEPSPIEIVREDIDVYTFWRVYVRVAPNLQNGQLGEPLKHYPWDFAARNSGDPDAFSQGGRLKFTVPQGYYIDLTQLAEDCGWGRLPSERQWRSNFSSLLYWQFEKRDGLTWEQAMLEIMSRADLQAFLSGPTLVPTSRPQITATTPPQRSPTPIPPA